MTRCGPVLAFATLVCTLGAPAFAADLTITAKHDRPGPVQVQVQFKDAGQAQIGGTTTLNWSDNDNGYAEQDEEPLPVPANARYIRLTFINDVGGGDPDGDRNAWIDHFTVGTRHFEAQDYTTTGGTDISFPGCGVPVRDGRRIADCGNQNDWVEYDLTETSYYGTTVITHGFTVSLNGDWCVGNPVSECLSTCPAPLDPSDWLIDMATAIRDRAGGGGTVLKYDPCTAEWLIVDGTNDPNEPVYLVSNWRQESDGLNNGGQFGLAEAAADALYASLRDPWLPAGLSGEVDLLAPGRGIHFIGHSRGTVVNSEVVERLSRAGIDVDQVTTLDPHPVDGSPPPNWGDPKPRTWKGVDWADNFWRSDLNPTDFDGQQIEGSYDRNLECALPEEPLPPSIEHSLVHTWYHGTIDLDACSVDGESIVDSVRCGGSNSWYEDPSEIGECTSIPTRDDTGYYFAISTAAGKRPDYPNQQPRCTAGYRPSLVYNGDFDRGSGVSEFAGWLYQGGNMCTTWTFNIAESSRGNYATLPLAGACLPGTDILDHNHLFVDDDVDRIRFERRVVSQGLNDQFSVILEQVQPPHNPPAFKETETLTQTTGWQTRSYCIPSALRGKSYTLRFEIDDVLPGLPLAVVNVDNVSFSTPGGSMQIDVNPQLVVWPVFDPCNPFLLHDLVYGDLNTLRTSGDFAVSTLGCLADDSDEGQVPFAADPGPGEAFWFVGRTVGAEGDNTYDSDGPEQSASLGCPTAFEVSRDPGIEASPLACQ